jgi:hypothetical protein
VRKGGWEGIPMMEKGKLASGTLRVLGERNIIKLNGLLHIALPPDLFSP